MYSEVSFYLKLLHSSNKEFLRSKQTPLFHNNNNTKDQLLESDDVLTSMINFDEIRDYDSYLTV